MKQLFVRAGLVAALVIVGGCGGGGGSDTTPVVTPFFVMGHVAGIPFKVPTPGVEVSLSMDSGDTLDVQASQAGMRWTLTTDGNTFTANVDENSASWQGTINSAKGGSVTLTATSLNDPSQQATLTVHVNAQRYAALAPRVGEVQVWQQTTVQHDGSSTSATLQASTVQVNADGSQLAEWRDFSGGTAGALVDTLALDASGNVLQRQVPGAAACTYDPALQLLQFPLYYQKAWTTQWQLSCTDGRHETADAAVAVDDVAPVTVPQGTHDALRVHAQVAITNASDTNLLLRSYSQDIACWWSVSMRRFVQCTVHNSYVGGVPGSYADTVTQSLLSAQ